MDDPDSPWAAVEDASGATSSDAERAASAMRALSPEQQRVIGLSVVEGLSQSEIATSTGLPLGTVKTLMRRGLLQSRAVLTGEARP